MMNKKQMCKLCLCFTLLLLLAACGQSEAVPEVPAVAEAEVVADTETAVSDEDTPADEAETSEPMRIENGGEVPFYARFGEDETFDDGEWTVIVFYRSPDCIPADFNLNRFFHFPDENSPGAFGCGPTTMDGIEVWQNSPETDPAPIEAEMSSRGEVPVWFVKWSELEEVMADGETTIGELAELPSCLVGTATTYNEFLKPTQSNSEPFIQFSGEGTLENGNPFRFDVSKGAPETADHVTIELEG